MLVRIRSKDGNFRFDLQPTDDFQVLVSKIVETAPNIDVDTLFISDQPRGGEKSVAGITGALADLGIGHGELYFVTYSEKDSGAPGQTQVQAPAQSSSAPTPAAASEGVVQPQPTASGLKAAYKPWEHVTEDEIDRYWEKQDGRIPRKKGEAGCRCGPRQMCDYCTPLEPWDTEYHTKNTIKHLSFHSFLRKTLSSAPPSASSASWIPPLSEPSYKVEVPCSSGSHPSWPAGICTKCQPSAVTLSRQTWRMVDHVEFAAADLINGLLSFWRTTGTQRFGFLLGRYEPYDAVPMGIKAVVEAVHEPPQEPLADGVTVGMPWEEKVKVEGLAKELGLEVVGMIFTDLQADSSTDEAKKKGLVVAKRHINSFFLSSLEVAFAATMQKAHPSPCKYSYSGAFSSKFVTVVLAGDADGNIAPTAYQVSDQARALMDADMIEPSVDPGIMRVKEEGESRYIPDVFYRYRNQYNLEVKESAKPCFPVEYLIVNVSSGFPTNPKPLFTTKTPFPTENRQGLQDQSTTQAVSSLNRLAKTVPSSLLGMDGQTFDAVADTSGKGKGKMEDDEALDKVADWFSDWHLLAFLDQTVFDPSDVNLMAQFARTRDPALLKKIIALPSWQTFLTIAQDEAPSAPPKTYPGADGQMLDDGFEIPPDVDVPPDAFDAAQNRFEELPAGGGGGGGGGSGGGTPGIRICPHCTFENPAGGSDCEICGLPLDG